MRVAVPQAFRKSVSIKDSELIMWHRQGPTPSHPLYYLSMFYIKSDMQTDGDGGTNKNHKTAGRMITSQFKTKSDC